METLVVSVDVEAPREKVWEFWNTPEHIMKWAFASDDWEAPFAENDLRKGGKFKTSMAAKDGGARFDFEGTYSEVIPMEHIAYTILDGRRVFVSFEK